MHVRLCPVSLCFASRRIVEEELPLYTCTDSYTGATSSGNETRSYNELATLMYVTGSLVLPMIVGRLMPSAQMLFAQHPA